MISQERLKELFHYDELTGIFTRIKKLDNRKGDGGVGKPQSTTNKKGYVLFRCDGRVCLAHRLAFIYMTGTVPDIVDHLNGIKNDNRWVNLRPATNQQNIYNSNRRRDNKSGFKGVSWDKESNKWRAHIAVDGLTKALGRFNTAEEAHQAYCKAAEQYGKEFANFGITVAA